MRRGIASILFLGLATPLIAWGVEPGTALPEPEQYGCGPLSLYCLSRLESHPLSLIEIDSRLSKPSDEGCSLGDLREIANSSGLKLEAVKLARDRSLDRPALVFIRQGRIGHFFVIRPVGHTGKLIQILDTERGSSIMDVDALYSMPEWTGFALIPHRPNWMRRIILSLAGASLLGLFTTALAPHLRGSLSSKSRAA